MSFHQNKFLSKGLQQKNLILKDNKTKQLPRSQAPPKNFEKNQQKLIKQVNLGKTIFTNNKSNQSDRSKQQYLQNGLKKQEQINLNNNFRQLTSFNKNNLSANKERKSPIRKEIYQDTQNEKIGKQKIPKVMENDQKKKFQQQNRQTGFVSYPQKPKISEQQNLTKGNFQNNNQQNKTKNNTKNIQHNQTIQNQKNLQIIQCKAQSSQNDRKKNETKLKFETSYKNNKIQNESPHLGQNKNEKKQNSPENFQNYKNPEEIQQPCFIEQQKIPEVMENNQKKKFQQQNRQTAFVSYSQKPIQNQKNLQIIQCKVQSSQNDQKKNKTKLKFETSYKNNKIQNESPYLSQNKNEKKQNSPENFQNYNNPEEIKQLCFIEQKESNSFLNSPNESNNLIQFIHKDDDQEIQSIVARKKCQFIENGDRQIFQVNICIFRIFYQALNSIVSFNESKIYFNTILEKYEGEINSNFQPHGNGKLSNFQDKNKQLIFIGQFEKGIKQGYIEEQLNGLICFQGQYQSNYRHGEGIEYIQNQQYKGVFNINRRDGNFIVSRNNVQWNEYYQYGVQDVRPKQKTQLSVPVYPIKQYGKYSINLNQLNSTLPGQWLNDGVIDYFSQVNNKVFLFQILQLYYQLRRNDLSFSKLSDEKSKNLLLTTQFFQDLAGSIVSTNLNYQTLNNYQNKHLNQTMFELYNRIIIPINFNRSHFLVIVLDSLDNQSIQPYFIDSFISSNQNYELLNRVIKLVINHCYNFVGIKMKILKNYQILKVSQQQNLYDCGIYSLFYINKLLKQVRLKPLENLQLTSNQEEINYFRHFIYLSIQKEEVLFVKFQN